MKKSMRAGLLLTSLDKMEAKQRMSSPVGIVESIARERMIVDALVEGVT
jgi:hypothetical protein